MTTNMTTNVVKSSNRGAKPGERRGGRAKGTPNRATKDILERMEALGCDPLEIMARIAIDINEDINLRFNAAKELAQYIAPKRRSVEMSDGEGGPVKLALVWMNE